MINTVRPEHRFSDPQPVGQIPRHDVYIRIIDFSQGAGGQIEAVIAEQRFMWGTVAQFNIKWQTADQHRPFVTEKMEIDDWRLISAS